METKFEHNFNGLVWRILLANDAPILLIETRNTENRTAIFYVFNLQTQSFIISDLELSEKWWLGVECVKNNCIYFHFYDGIQYSNHKGILCYDLLLKKQSWKNEKMIFIGWNKNSIIASDNGILYQLDALSGEIIVKDVLYNVDNQSKSDILFIDEEMEQFAKIAAFIAKKTQRIAVKHVEYLEYKSSVLISYYICEDNKFDNYFMLADANNGNILLDIILDSQSQGVGSESFAIYNDYLILCKNKKNLSIYAL